MIGAIHADLLARPAKVEPTLTEMRERERRRDAVKALLGDITRPSVIAMRRKAA